MNTPQPQTEADTTRREFGKALAALAAVPLVPVLKASAAEKSSAVAAESLAEVVNARYGKHLSADQRKAVARSILRSQRTAERLSEFKLKNGDEPAFTFRADLP